MCGVTLVCRHVLALDVKTSPLSSTEYLQLVLHNHCKQILSAARFVPHPLNTQGLHLLRCVLAERVAEARAAARGYDRHPDYAAWKRDGVIVKNWDEMTDEDLHKLLQVRPHPILLCAVCTAECET